LIRLPSDATIEDLSQADLANFGRQGAQGMSFGSSDEIEAALRSLLGEKSYSENLDSIRSELAKFDEENPEASMGAFIAGIAPTLGISAPALFARLATRLGKYGATSALGALGGFTEGFLTGEGTRDRIEGGATWGAIGSVLGPVLVKGVELAPQVAQFFSNLKNKLSNVRMDPNTLGSNLGNLRFDNNLKKAEKNKALREEANKLRFGEDFNNDGWAEYLEKINQNQSPIESRPNFMMGDFYGMLPKNATKIKTLDGVTYYKSKEGDYYATANNPDLNEEDVIGYIIGGEKHTDLHVVSEMQNKGIGGELQYLFRKDNPNAPAGGLTLEGEKLLRQTYERLKKEGVLDTKPELEPVEEYLYRKSTLPEAKQRAEEVNRIVNEARFEGRELKPAEIDHIRTIENHLDIDYLRKIINRPMDRESRRKRAVELVYDLDDSWYRGRKDKQDQTEISGRPFMSKEPILASTYVPSYGGGRHQGEIAELVVSDRLNPTRITVNPGVPEAYWGSIPIKTAKMKIDDGDWHLVKDNPNFSHIERVRPRSRKPTGTFTTDDFTKAANEIMPMLKDDYAVPKPTIVDFENLVDRGSHDSYRSLISDYDLQISPSPNTPIRNQSVIGGGSSIRKTSAIFEPLLRNMKNLNFVVPIAGALPLITPEGER